MTIYQKVMPDDHSKVVPLLPIPNRTVKRLSADDSADSRVKVGHRQALTVRNAQLTFSQLGFFFWGIGFYYQPMLLRHSGYKSPLFWLRPQRSTLRIIPLSKDESEHPRKTSP